MKNRPRAASFKRGVDPTQPHLCLAQRDLHTYAKQVRQTAGGALALGWWQGAFSANLPSNTRMKTIINLSVLLVLLVTNPSPCFALREIAVITKKEAKEMGIEVRAHTAGPDAVWLELEFKPEGKLKEFTHVELNMGEGKKAFVVSATLRETRSSSGSILVTLTASRAYFEKITLSVVMHSPREAGDHTYELRMKDFVDLEKVR